MNNNIDTMFIYFKVLDKHGFNNICNNIIWGIGYLDCPVTLSGCKTCQLIFDDFECGVYLLCSE